MVPLSQWFSIQAAELEIFGEFLRSPIPRLHQHQFQSGKQRVEPSIRFVKSSLGYFTGQASWTTHAVGNSWRVQLCPNMCVPSLCTENPHLSLAPWSQEEQDEICRTAAWWKRRGQVLWPESSVFISQLCHQFLSCMDLDQFLSLVFLPCSLHGNNNNINFASVV